MNVRQVCVSDWHVWNGQSYLPPPPRSLVSEFSESLRSPLWPVGGFSNHRPLNMLSASHSDL